MKKIVIMVSTYNGERYLKEQLDSIFEQDCTKDNIKISVLVRDDGSSDDTLSKLEEYASTMAEDEYKEFSYYAGKNKGVIKSFFELMSKAPEADYYAFSDQDDVWLGDKLSRAISIIDKNSFVEKNGRSNEIAYLYTCAPLLVDSELNIIDSNIDRSDPEPSFKNALIENICVGCTEVFNKKLFNIVNDRFPEFTIMHDWWLYLTASCFGKVYYDNEPGILYRQHEGNVLGMKTSHVKEFKERVKRFKKNRNNISNQLAEFVRIFRPVLESELYEAEAKESYKQIYDEFFCDVPINAHAIYCLKLADGLLNVKNSPARRIEFLKKAGIYRQRTIDDMIFRVILLMGNY